MRTVGVIVEYNPFHNGHRYHLQQAKKITSSQQVVAIMSGNFLQRGEPALVDKWTRAEMALSCGVDLVLELPLLYVCQPAEWFAFGAVALLEATGIVDTLCFGSEDGHLNWMHQPAKTIASEPRPFQQTLRHYLNQGWSYPRAYSEALQAFHPNSQPYLAKPNNILGLAYMAALNRLDSTITPYTIPREKADYHQADLTDKEIASATAIREAWITSENIHSIQPYVPSSTFDLLKKSAEKGRSPITWESLHQALFGKLIPMTSEQLKKYAGIDEGLEHRLKQKLPHAATVDDFIAAVKTKRYTWNRLQRTLVAFLLEIHKTDAEPQQLEKGPTYLRVLGFTDRGRALLKKMRRTATLPVLTRIKQDRPPMLEWDLRAGAMYSLATRWRLPFKEEFDRIPIYVPSSRQRPPF